MCSAQEGFSQYRVSWANSVPGAESEDRSSAEKTGRHKQRGGCLTCPRLHIRLMVLTSGVVGAKSRNVAWGLTVELQGQQTL